MGMDASKTVVVTGGSGHLGANLVRLLLAQGRRVRALVRKDLRALLGYDLELVNGDICDPDSLRRAFQGADVVYHSAAHISLVWGEWPELEAINIQGVQNVVDACLACGVRRLIHFSSIHALFQEPLDLPVDEERPLVDDLPDALIRRQPPYDISKACGERIVRLAISKGLDAVILHPTGIIGPYDYKPSHFGEVLLALARGKMPALVEAGFDWVDARDVAWGALQAEGRAPAGARYLLSGSWVSMPDLAALVSTVIGRPAPRLVFPLRLARLGLPFAGLFQGKGQRPLYTSVSIHALESNPNVSHAHATQDLDYRPRPFEQTIRDTLGWFTGEGYLNKIL